MRGREKVEEEQERERGGERERENLSDKATSLIVWTFLSDVIKFILVSLKLFSSLVTKCLTTKDTRVFSLLWAIIGFKLDLNYRHPGNPEWLLVGWINISGLIFSFKNSSWKTQAFCSCGLKWDVERNGSWNEWISNLCSRTNLGGQHAYFHVWTMLKLSFLLIEN